MSWTLLVRWFVCRSISFKTISSCSRHSANCWFARWSSEDSSRIFLSFSSYTQEMTNYKYNICSFVGNSRSQKILKAKFATWEKALNTRKFSDISHYSIEVAHDFGGARTHNQAHFLHFGNQTQFVSVKKIACQKKGKNHNMKFTGKSDGYGNHSSMSNTRVAGELLEVP